MGAQSVCKLVNEVGDSSPCVVDVNKKREVSSILQPRGSVLYVVRALLANHKAGNRAGKSLSCFSLAPYVATTDDCRSQPIAMLG
jgi:hypothetical protein